MENEFICDRPFIFIIRDEETGLNLFEGKVVHPQEYMGFLQEEDEILDNWKHAFSRRQKKENKFGHVTRHLLHWVTSFEWGKNICYSIVTCKY